MEKIKVNLNFQKNFHGSFESSRGSTLKLGRDADEFLPYELLPAALGSCYFVTLEGILNKQRLAYEGANIEISGHKREQPPTTLERLRFVVSLEGTDREQAAKYQRAAELAAKYCSIYETISQVAEMELVINLD
ncbi:MAG: OsmC family protein [Eubacteriales bacterium]|nr:OsmC family protein [Eubacteriales bacterium]